MPSGTRKLAWMVSGYEKFIYKMLWVLDTFFVLVFCVHTNYILSNQMCPNFIPYVNAIIKWNHLTSIL